LQALFLQIEGANIKEHLEALVKIKQSNFDMTDAIALDYACRVGDVGYINMFFDKFLSRSNTFRSIEKVYLIVKENKKYFNKMMVAKLNNKFWQFIEETGYFSMNDMATVEDIYKTGVIEPKEFVLKLVSHSSFDCAIWALRTLIELNPTTDHSKIAKALLDRPYPLKSSIDVEFLTKYIESMNPTTANELTRLIEQMTSSASTNTNVAQNGNNSKSNATQRENVTVNPAD